MSISAANRAVEPLAMLENGPVILVVDDDVSSLMIISAILEQDGYRIISANSGGEAIQIFQDSRPDLVVMDVLMDGIDGYEAAKQMMNLAGDRLVPLIFVTGLHDPELLAQCFTSGGIDYIEKPYNPIILRSKVKTFINLARLYHEAQRQRDEVTEYNEYLKTGYEVAKGVFDKVMHSDVLDSPGFVYSLSPVAIFNGDIIMAAYRPTGELHIMLGDFVGHGVSAAIGAIPVSDIFYGMTSKGFPTNDIAQEIHNKLNRIMPRGLFLAGCILEYIQERKMLHIWNAGVPVVVIFNKSSRAIKHISISKNLPFGVVPGIISTGTAETVLIEAGDMLLLCTDGVTETANEKNEMYGVDRIIACIQHNRHGSIIDAIKADLDKFSSHTGQKDDLTLVTVDFDDLQDVPTVNQLNVYPEPVRNAAWQMNFSFEAEILKLHDPLPGIIQMLMDVQRLHKVKQDIFIIIKELFTNSLEHGLLELDSKIKQTANGFGVYYEQRQTRLAALQTGSIRITIQHHPQADGGEVIVTVQDSGKGFDYTALQAQLDHNGHYHGRGLLLVRSLCDSVAFADQGREISARYHWRHLKN